MRVIAFSILILLTGCGTNYQKPVPILSALPSFDRTVPVHHHRAKAKPVAESKPADEAQKSVEAQKPAKEQPRTWDISEDRFITTHQISISVDALHRSEDEIQARLLELNLPK